jgi:hypothetical protein
MPSDTQAEMDWGGTSPTFNTIKLGATRSGTTGTEVTATAAELNAVADDSARYVAAGSALTLTVATHNKRTIKLDTAAGSTVTLPAATGSGAVFNFIVTTLATSNSHIIKVANASDTMQGSILIVDTDTAGATSGFAAGATADTITLNRTTTGSVSLGEWIEVEDVAANKWQVSGVVTGTGTVATAFSATVS